MSVGHLRDGEVRQRSHEWSCVVFVLSLSSKHQTRRAIWKEKSGFWFISFLLSNSEFWSGTALNCIVWDLYQGWKWIRKWHMVSAEPKMFSRCWAFRCFVWLNLQISLMISAECTTDGYKNDYVFRNALHVLVDSLIGIKNKVSIKNILLTLKLLAPTKSPLYNSTAFLINI